MAYSYKTTQYDRIDQIVLKHYGNLEMLEEVIKSNPHLAKLPLILDCDLEIYLPDIQTLPTTKTIDSGDALW